MHNITPKLAMVRLDLPYTENNELYERMQNNYSDFWKHKGFPYGDTNADLIRTVKKIIYGTSKPQCPQSESLIETFRYIIEQIYQLTPDELDSIYCTQINKKIRIENLIRKILQTLSLEVKGKYCFITKRIIFGTIYPEYYKSHFPQITSHDIFYAKNELKAACIHAGKIHTATKHSATNAGSTIDKLLFDAIEDVFDELQTSEADDKFRDDGFLKDDVYLRLEWFASPKPLKADSGKKLPGCISLIKNRSCYACPIDFYFLNMSLVQQLNYIDDFMEIRRNGQIPESPTLNLLYELYQQNQTNLEKHIMSGDSYN